MRLPGLLPLLLLCPLALPACARSHGSPSYGAIPAAKVTASSRVSMPVAGGQTIAVPQHMGDAYALWSPLSNKERRFKYEGPLPPMDMRLASWLPKSEEGVMRSYLYRLTHGQSSLASRALARAEQYMPAIMREVKQQGLPEEIACLPLVESAFQPRAVSPAGAAGLWQLMPDTARRFGLAVNANVDERFDVEKSTAAATAYLAVLYREFGDWPLAIASYNCGEGKMRQALQTSGAKNLTELTAASRNGASPYLAEETLRFVPQFTAAVQVMQHGGLDAASFTTAAGPIVAPPLLASHNPDDGGAKLTLKAHYGDKYKNRAAPPRSKRLQ